MSRYLIEDEVLVFLASGHSEKAEWPVAQQRQVYWLNSEEEISDLDWISTDDGEEDKEEISSCDSSSVEEMDDQPCSSAWANYFVFKTKTWQPIPFANNVESAADHNVIRQSLESTRFAKFLCSEISDTFTLFLWSSLRKTTCSELITKKP